MGTFPKSVTQHEESGGCRVTPPAHARDALPGGPRGSEAAEWGAGSLQEGLPAPSQGGRGEAPLAGVSTPPGTPGGEDVTSPHSGAMVSVEKHFFEAGLVPCQWGEVQEAALPPPQA